MKKPKRGPAGSPGLGARDRDRKGVFEEEQRYHLRPGFQCIAFYSRLALASGRNEIVVDEDGKEYIDFVSGIGVGSTAIATPPMCEP